MIAEAGLILGLDYLSKIINAKYFWNGPEKRDTKTEEQFRKMMIPLVGDIYYLLRRKSNPALQKACDVKDWVKESYC